jgi:hypothetical protein
MTIQARIVVQAARLQGVGGFVVPGALDGSGKARFRISDDVF